VALISGTLPVLIRRATSALLDTVNDSLPRCAAR
jgi:hypothetical protein